MKGCSRIAPPGSQAVSLRATLLDLDSTKAPGVFAALMVSGECPIFAPRRALVQALKAWRSVYTQDRRNCETKSVSQEAQTRALAPPESFVLFFP